MLPTWRKRGFMPFKWLCEFAFERNLSLDWLFAGRGEPTLSLMSWNVPSLEVREPTTATDAYMDFAERHRQSEKLVGEVLTATAFKPSPVLREAMRGIAFTKQVEGEHLLALVAGVREMVDAARSQERIITPQATEDWP